MKKTYIKIIEKFFNKTKKNNIELFYGSGSHIKVNNIQSNNKGELIMVDVTIVLGNVITEEVLDRSLIDYLMMDVIDIMFPETTLKVLLNWDVS